MRYLMSLAILLPDMSQCEHLQHVTLNEGHFVFPGKIPFPRGLRELKGRASCLIYEIDSSLGLSMHDGFNIQRPWFDEVNRHFQQYFENCAIELKIIEIGHLLYNCRWVCITADEFLEFIHIVIGNEAEIQRLDVKNEEEEDDDAFDLKTDENKVQPTITLIDVMQLAAKCPKMVELNMSSVSVKFWPPLTVPWMFLRKLDISRVSKQCFKSVKFEDTIPNLRILRIEGKGIDSPTILPDMSRCEVLSSITLDDRAFVLPDKIPFPYGLRKLKGTSSSLYCTKASLLGTMMESIFDLDEVNQLFQIYRVEQKKWS